MINGIFKKIFFCAIFLFSVFLSQPIVSYSQGGSVSTASRTAPATTNDPILVNYKGVDLWVERILERDSSGRENPNSWFFRPIINEERIKNLGGNTDTQIKHKEVALQVNATVDYGSGNTTYSVSSAKNSVLENKLNSDNISVEDSKKIKTAGAGVPYSNLGELTKVQGTQDQYTSPNYPGIIFTIKENSSKTELEVRSATKDGIELLNNITSEDEFKARQAEIERQIEEANKSAISCSFPSRYFFECWLAKVIYVTVFGISTTAIKLSGTLFDFVINYTIVDLKANLSDASIINTGWIIFRDIANIFFIFFMIYIAITTIIQGTGKTAEGIKNIIIVAVLINFSLFFTKVVIDVSNTAAVSFYNSITKEIAAKKPLEYTGVASGNVNTAIFGDQRTVAEAFISRAGLISFLNVPPGHLNYLMVSKQLLIASAVYLVVAFVLFMASLLLITRYIILIVVMLLSSLAFGAYVLPSFKSKVSDKWWEALTGQAFVAPVFLLLLYISLLVLKTMPIGQSSVGFGNLEGNGVANDFLRLVMVIGLLIFSIKTAKSLSDKAGGMAGTITKAVGGTALGLAAWTSRNTAGRLANNLASGMEPKTAFGGFVKRRLEGVANSSFDARNSRLGGAILKQSGIDVGKAPKDASYSSSFAKRAANAKKRAESISNEVDPNDPQGRTHREIYQQSFMRNFTGGGAYRAQVLEKNKLQKEINDAKKAHDKMLNDSKDSTGLLTYADHAQKVKKAEADLVSQRSALAIAMGNGNSAVVSNIQGQIANNETSIKDSKKEMKDIEESTQIKTSNKNIATLQAKFDNIGKGKEVSQADILKQLEKLEAAQKSK